MIPQFPFNPINQPLKKITNKKISTENHDKFDKKNKSNSNDSYLFDLFGLKLYNDDILILGLLFFLYTEGVQDTWLFLVLLLLLLS
jgi:hypothetical protein